MGSFFVKVGEFIHFWQPIIYISSTYRVHHSSETHVNIRVISRVYKDATTKLDKIQRPALLAITEATKTSPTGAISPLNLIVIGEARMGYSRLHKNTTALYLDL